MTRLSLFALVAVFGLSFDASAKGASAPQISVNVDRQPIVQGEPFTLQISIETEGQGKPEIVIPRFGGFRILKQYESHPSSFHFSFGFGGQNTNVHKEQSNYSFVLVADKPGTFKINPVVVKLGGQRYTGNAYQLNVVKGGGASGTPAPLTPDPTQPPSGFDDPAASDPGQQEVTDLEGAKVEPDFFVQTAVSKKEAYVGEMLTMTIYLYMSRQLSNYDILREPGTEGFWGENLVPSDQRHLSTESVTIGGRLYDRVALRHMALFPIKPGQLTIAPTVVEIETQRGIFFSKRRAVKRASLPVTVTVLDLPAENQPPGFNPANVGRYAFKTSVDQENVKVGEPVTLTMTVRGVGNLRNLSLPTVEEVDGFKTYAPETEVTVSPRGETVTGTSESRVLMIPKSPGTYTIPRIDWSYFDPASKTYTTLSGKPFQVTVSSSGETSSSQAGVSTGPAPRRAGQDRLNRQLRSILSRADLSRRKTSGTLTSPWFLALFIGVPLMYAGFVLFSRTRRRLAESRIRNRSKHADTESLRRLKTLEKTREDLSSDEFFGTLARCLIGFIEDRLEANAAGDTMIELRERLLARGFSSDQAEHVVAEMEACDFARFAKGAGEAEERQQALKRVEDLIRTLAEVKVTPLKEEKKR